MQAAIHSDHHGASPPFGLRKIIGHHIYHNVWISIENLVESKQPAEMLRESSSDFHSYYKVVNHIVMLYQKTESDKYEEKKNKHC